MLLFQCNFIKLAQEKGYSARQRLA